MKLTVEKNSRQAKNLVKLTKDSVVKKAKALKVAAPTNKAAQVQKVNLTVKPKKEPEPKGKKVLLTKQVEESDEDMNEEESDAQYEEEQEEDSDAPDVKEEYDDSHEEEDEEEDGDAFEEEDEEEDGDAIEEEDEEDYAQSMEIKQENSDAEGEEEGSDSDEDVEENPAAVKLRSMIEEDMINGALKLKGNFTIGVFKLPVTFKKDDVSALFSKYGKIVSIVIRRDNKHPEDSIETKNAYVRFILKKDMEKALEMDGRMVDKLRIKVFKADTYYTENECAVCVQNLSEVIQENELFQFFQRAGPIDTVKMTKTKTTAFVSFKKAVSVFQALKLNGEILKGQSIVVKRLDKDGYLVHPSNKSHSHRPPKPYGASRGRGGPYRGKAFGQRGVMRNGTAFRGNAVGQRGMMRNGTAFRGNAVGQRGMMRNGTAFRGNAVGQAGITRNNSMGKGMDSKPSPRNIFEKLKAEAMNKKQ